ncbi:MAG: hypothetical protein HOQ35_16825 [Acidobacteriaceae bacterium]|nr:hypothetical protein [Acidobacteriaceae bacterium]
MKEMMLKIVRTVLFLAMAFVTFNLLSLVGLGALSLGKKGIPVIYISWMVKLLLVLCADVLALAKPRAALIVGALPLAICVSIEPRDHFVSSLRQCANDLVMFLAVGGLAAIDVWKIKEEPGKVFSR